MPSTRYPPLLALSIVLAPCSSALACTQLNPRFDGAQGESGSGAEETSLEQGSETEAGASICGDGELNVDDEQCDDGNADNTDGCMANCLIPHSCAEILEFAPDTPSGTYLVDPMGIEAPWLAACDMDLDGGGWTGFRVEDIVCDEHLANELTGLVSATEESDEDCRLLTNEPISGAFEYYWDIAFPPGFDAFFLRDYEVKGLGQPELNFVQVVWEQAAQFPNGSLSFGSSYASGPKTTWLAEGGASGSFEDGEVRPYPVLDVPFELAEPSDSLRIGWGERGQMPEGLFPWWSGYIFVR